MDHQEIESLLAPYVLDAVEPHETAEIDAHLLDCADCRAEVASYRRALGNLAVDEHRSPTETAPAGTLHEQERPDRSATPAWVRLALVAILLLATAPAAVLLFRDSRGSADLASRSAERMEEAVEAPGSTEFALESREGDLSLPVSITEDNRGHLDARALPALPIDRTYQLWGVVGDRRIPLGVLGPEPGVVTFRVHLFRAFAVTDELAPGVEESLRPAVVSGRLPRTER